MEFHQLSYEEKFLQLREQIKSSLNDTWRKYKVNDQLDRALTLFAIILSTLVTILAFEEKGTDASISIAGIVGAILTSVLNLQKVFSLNGKANFYRRIHIETKELRDKLKYKVNSEEELQEIVDAFIYLRNERISANPRRQSLDQSN